MDKRIAKLWITALNSGKYQQGMGVLCRVEDKECQYCCLGVLCDLYLKENGPDSLKVRENDAWDDYDTVIAYGGEVEILPIKVQQWAGMVSKKGDLPGVDPVYQRSDLAAINDEGADFSEMAELIKEYYPVL
jgi:hypothetical protein